MPPGSIPEVRPVGGGRRFARGLLPGPFPAGEVCHGSTEAEACRQICALVREAVEDLQREGQELPPPYTRPMREAVLA